jgi:site-specific recombinase XerD
MAEENNTIAQTPSISFQRAVEKFSRNLSEKQQKEFAATTLEDVQNIIDTIQRDHGSRKKLRHMARIQAFLEAMEQYGKVVEVFLNSTIFLGYVWVSTAPKKRDWKRTDDTNSIL